MRLAQLKIHDAPGPLLPSLKQLRVIGPNELSISQLSLFFSESLQTVEANSVPKEQQAAFLSFLITLIGEAPLLSTIKLGPGSFTASCLNTCLKFDHLRHLELVDAALSIDFDFLIAVGGLPELKNFILNARTATYMSPPVVILKQEVLSDPPLPTLDGGHPIGSLLGAPSPPFANSTPILPTNTSLFGPVNNQSPSDPDGAAPVGHFSRLRRLDVIGSFSLIEDLYKYVISVDLERLEMTLVHKSTKIKKSSPSPSTIKLPATSKIDSEIDSFFALVKNAVEQKWPLTLKGVHLGHFQDFKVLNLNGYVDPLPVSIPFETFTILLKHGILEDLEIAGWTVPYSSDKKHPIDQVLQATLPNLKLFHLPIGGPTPGVQIDQLLPIVRAFPKLVSLQCGLEQPWTSIPLTPAASVPLHGLKVLSVGHQNSNIDQKQQIRIASFLDILFPNLECIKTHAGHHEDVWAYICELIKMCQASRLNHEDRLWSHWLPLS